MSSLTGQQINQSYQGLLKLADSSTGITQSFQQIQDGLGNNTGILIAEDYLSAPNIFNTLPLKNDYWGPGFSTTGVAPVAGTQNVILAHVFYDPGLYSYSALTYNVQTLSNTDTVEVAFYSSQSIEGIGVAPHQLILSGVSLPVTSTGVQTASLPSSLSFSGYGGGVFFMCMKISNAGVTPTVRFTGPFSPATQGLMTFLGQRYGFTSSTVSGNPPVPGIKVGTNATSAIFYTGISSFKTTYDSTDVSGYSTSANAPTYGFLLNTIW